MHAYREPWQILEAVLAHTHYQQQISPEHRTRGLLPVRVYNTLNASKARALRLPPLRLLALRPLEQRLIAQVWLALQLVPQGHGPSEQVGAPR